MDFNEFIKEFEIFTGVKVPEKCIEDYRFTGLNNTDFITMEFINDYGLNIDFSKL